MKKHDAKRLTTRVILFIFFFLLFFIPFSLYIASRNQPGQIISIPTPTIKQTPITALPTPTIIPSVSLPLISQIQTHISPTQDPQTRLLEKIQNRQPLSSGDLAAKNKIVSLLPQGQNSGVVYHAKDFTVDYVQNPDLFQVEVLITDTQKAKTEAITWFSDEGVSQQGICNLPIDFYLNSGVKTQMSNPDSFNPLPDNC